jgi:hypothetical protein
MVGRFRAVLFACVLLAVFCPTNALAREVSVTVTVLDPTGQPIEGALAIIASGISTLSEPIPTNARGEATVAVDIPDARAAVTRVLILDNPPKGTPDEQFLDALEALNASRMFEGNGYPVGFAPNQDSAFISAKASPVEIREGAVESLAGGEPGAFLVLDAESIALGFVIDGSYRSLVPTDRAFFAGLLSDFGTSYHHVPVVQPDGSVPPLTHAIPAPDGGLAGVVVTNGQLPDRPFSLLAIREDGAYGLALGVDESGRIAFNRETSPDPTSRDEQNNVPPGDYVILFVSNEAFGVRSEPLAYLRARLETTAVPERASLPRMTVHPNHRTVVTLDVDTLRSTTEALMTAVYFTPH